MINISIKKYSVRLLSILIVLSGLFELYHELFLILVEFPKIPEEIAAHNYDLASFDRLITASVIITMFNLFSAYIGLRLFIKPTHTIEKIHVLVAILALSLTLYVRVYGANQIIELIYQLNT